MKKLLAVFILLLVWAFFVRPPVSGGLLTSWFGPRIFAGRTFHTGSDIALPAGTQVNPMSWGTVKTADYGERQGNYVIIAHALGVTSRYYHLDSINVTAGQRVAPSTSIGTVGNTGISTGSHLHFEIRFAGIPLPAYTLTQPGRLFNKAGGYRVLNSIGNIFSA